MSVQYELVEKVVKAGGTVGVNCDYTDIKAALDDIADNSAGKRYVLRILNGTYDVSNDGNLYLGLKNYVDLIGQSRGGVRIVKRDDDYSDAKNVFDTAYYGQRIEYASLRNLTLIGYNLKAPVHIDDEYLQGTIELVDCTLINENTPDMGNYRNGLACGLRQGQRVVARGVHSNGMLWMHNGFEAYAGEGCRFELYNCISPFIVIGELITYGNDTIVIEGCRAEFLRYLYIKGVAVQQLRPYVQSSFSFELRGNSIDYVEAVTTMDLGYTSVPTAFDELCEGKWSISDPSIHQFVRNTGAADIVRGSLVSRNGDGVKRWASGERLYGMALDVILPVDYGIVQDRGIVFIPVHPDTEIAEDEPVELDASGRAVRHGRGEKIGVAQGRYAHGDRPLKVKLTKSQLS
ncbi:hypothetical protein SAMN05216312_108293 [Cohnella sp. OV330]|uniref:hypothetical protein n=1 Tax=Cohnella sp. OV330 TaxID=1855288 RepID=UPI0008EE2B1F|nr:hypothetical protein [Cohnella sp. OV330]SFB45280.1 hypothetical protein SAMN05216312_108293 [Cohnella sp. OV330]